MAEPLGRGLESLIPDKKPEEIPGTRAAEIAAIEASEAAPLPTGTTSTSPRRRYEDHFQPKRDESVFWIELDKIEPNPYQPRREFNEETMRELALSIREHGVLQPILVTKREIETPTGLSVRYQLIAGERRWRAARMSGLSQIPAIVRRGIPDDRIRLEIALIENVQREDLNAMDRARAFRQLIVEFKLVQREISTRIGKSREAIANTLRLLTLPSEIQDGISKGLISEGHARAILMVGDDAAKQQEFYKEIVADRTTVRTAEVRARQISGRTLRPYRRASRVADPELQAWEERLQEHFGTKVHLHKAGERGKIVVEFYSDEELRGLINRLIQQV